MDNREFDREIKYQLTMKYVRDLKKRGIFTEKEYTQIDTIMLEKYKPVLGTLLSGNPLT